MPASIASRLCRDAAAEIDLRRKGGQVALPLAGGVGQAPARRRLPRQKGLQPAPEADQPVATSAFALCRVLRDERPSGCPRGRRRRSSPCRRRWSANGPSAPPRPEVSLADHPGAELQAADRKVGRHGRCFRARPLVGKGDRRKCGQSSPRRRTARPARQWRSRHARACSRSRTRAGLASARPDCERQVAHLSRNTGPSSISA